MAALQIYFLKYCFDLDKNKRDTATASVPLGNNAQLSAAENRLATELPSSGSFFDEYDDEAALESQDASRQSGAHGSAMPSDSGTFDVEAIEIDSKSEGFGEPHSTEPEDGYAAKSRIFGRVQGREQYFEELRACGTDL